MPAKSKAQQRFFGMIDAYKKGKMKHAPKKIRDAAKHISDEDARDFAKTKHEGLPEKVAHIICSRRMEKKAAAARRSMLVKQAVQAIIDGRADIEPIFHTKEHLLFDSLHSPKAGYSYGMSGDAMRKAFDSHGNIKLTSDAAKALNLDLGRLKGGSDIMLPHALLTPGSHQSGAAIRSRLPKRLERQLYRGELNDAAVKWFRGGKKDRLVELLGSKSGKIRDMASMLLRKHASAPAP